MFKKNENVVYPAHGVCVVKDVVKRIINGKEKSFYMLKVLENELIIMAPTNASEVGLRAIVKKAEAKKVLNHIKEFQPKIDGSTWNRRYRDMMEKIRTGNIYEIAEVFKTLTVIKNTKDLSFGERKMLDCAKNLLLIELALSLELQPVETETFFELYAG